MSAEDLGPNPTHIEVLERINWLTRRVNVLLDLHLPAPGPEHAIALLKHKVRKLEERVALLEAQTGNSAGPSAQPDSSSSQGE